MGSIEVYDYQQMKWVPYIPQPDKADRYYKHTTDKIEKEWQKSDSLTAQQLRETTEKLRAAEEQLKRMDERTPEVKQVTDVAEAIKRAEDDVRRERKKARAHPYRKSTLPKRVRKLRY